jgi:uncharacterized membrane protein
LNNVLTGLQVGDCSDKWAGAVVVYTSGWSTASTAMEMVYLLEIEPGETRIWKFYITNLLWKEQFRL